MNTDTKTNTDIAAYTPTKAALADLRKRYEKVVYDVTTTQSMSDAIRRLPALDKRKAA